MSTEAKETTSDTSDGIECPVCGETIFDLWDYTWVSDECIDIECSHCDAPLTLSKCVSVDFTARARR